MTLSRLDKAPFPYFGGKGDAADLIWQRLGDPEHYVEPFFGSGVALLRRPALCNRSYYSETVNDLDGLLCNFWRAIQHSPDATAEAASWPVSECDLMARHLALLAWKRDPTNVERLCGDPHWHDPKMAGWWAWGISSWIGSGWCSGRGPWIVGDDGRITKRPKGGGVARQLPHLVGNGMGVNVQTAREPGVHRKRPHISDNGQGVNVQTARELGVARQRPHLVGNGMVVLDAGLRAEGVADEDHDFHPMTMPEIRRWLAFLSARLRHVRILCGDWKRACTSGALKTLSVRQGGFAGVFLDPPYRADGTRAADLYAHDDGDEVSAEVRAWCVANGADPRYRIALAGFAGEGHEALEALGWTCETWFADGWLKGGMAQQNEEEGHQQDKERIWFSPGCLQPAKEAPRQGSLFG